LVEDARAKGALILIGGRGRNDLAHLGFFYEPTILTGVKSDMDIFNEEIFGPVVSIIRYLFENVG
jgi:succinate-semialdehyde dehydrogenase/glutarate-semialdehyde dehydrogenase